VERWLGVDVGGNRKGFDVAVVSERRLVALQARLDAEAVLAIVAEHRPAVVAIDSPCCYAPDGQTSREGERRLNREVCHIRWTPDERRADGAYYEWIHEGLVLYEALAKHSGLEVIEVFPTASWTRWLGPRTGSRSDWTRDGLARLGLEDVPRRTNQDQRDAIAAAVTARQHGAGSTESLGEIAVPRALQGVLPSLLGSEEESPRSTHRPGWLIDELGHAGRENLDAAHVARYDAKEDASAADEVSLLQTVDLTRESLVLEFGAGTGQFSVAVAPVCARLIVVDISEPMLERLASKIGRLCLENVELARAGFLTYEHRGDPADFIYSRYALHHLPDFWKGVALSRLRTMLRPGGLLRLWDVVYDFAPSAAEERIEAWRATAGDNFEAAWSRAELEEHVRDEHSTFTWLLEPMIARSGFAIEQAEHSEDGIFAKYLCRAV
jgi:SAM-dependent methyltransferase/predicted nuclease with RNAse H fold